MTSDFSQMVPLKHCSRSQSCAFFMCCHISSCSPYFRDLNSALVLETISVLQMMNEDGHQDGYQDGCQHGYQKGPSIERALCSVVIFGVATLLAFLLKSNSMD